MSKNSQNKSDQDVSWSDMKMHKKKQFIFDIFWGVFVIAAVVCIRIYLFSPFLVNGPSMSPTFETSQYLLVEKITKRSHNPERGDVLVFKRTDNQTGRSRKLIKRTIGLPGETIKLSDGEFLINGEKINQDWYFQDTRGNAFLKEGGEITLGSTQYFVSGDNRRVSYDSRAFGPIDQSQIIGQPLFRAFQLRPFKFFFDGRPGRNI